MKLPANAGDIEDAGSIPGSGRSPGGGHGNPLHYSCLENPVDRGTCRLQVHRVAKSQTQLKQLSMFAHAHYTCLPKSNAKFWWGCGIIIGTVLPCSWEYKMVQPFCKTVWQFLTKLNILLPYEPAILLLGIYPKSWKLVSTKTLAHGSLQQQLFA